MPKAFTIRHQIAVAVLYRLCIVVSCLYVNGTNTCTNACCQLTRGQLFELSPSVLEVGCWVGIQ
jgi:hypothetical protein